LTATTWLPTGSSSGALPPGPHPAASAAAAHEHEKSGTILPDPTDLAGGESKM